MREETETLTIYQDFNTHPGDQDRDNEGEAKY